MMWEQSDNFSFAFFTPLRVLGGGVHPLQIEPAGTVQAGMRHLQEEAVGGPGRESGLCVSSCASPGSVTERLGASD